MDTLNSTSILASIIAQNPYHIVSIQGQMPMSHAQIHMTSKLLKMTQTMRKYPILTRNALGIYLC